MPGRDISAARSRIPAGDREVALLMAMSHPRVVVFGDLLSAEECAELIALARTRLARSETVATRTGESEVNEARTSDGMFFQPAEFPVCARLEARLAAAARLAAGERRGPADPALPPGRRIQAALRLFRPRRARHAGDPEARRPAPGLDRLLPQHPRGRRRHRLSRSRDRGRPGPGQCRLLQLRPAAPFHPHPARRRPGDRRGEVGRDQVDAGGPVRITMTECQPPAAAGPLFEPSTRLASQLLNPSGRTLE